MEEFSTVVRAYTEIGILGLLAVLMVILIWRSFGKKQKDDDWKTGKIDVKDDIINSNSKEINNQLTAMIEMIKDQNKKYQELQQEFMTKRQEEYEILINKIVDGVYHKVPSNEENTTLTDINRKVDTILQEILIETRASRINLVQYHNGGKGINKQAFLKMSITNEKINIGVKPIISEFKDQFRSVLGWFVAELDTKGQCYVSNVEDIKDIDIGMYEFMKNRGIEAKFGYAIHNNEGCVIAFLAAEYINKNDVNVERINDSFKEHYREVERLLTTHC